jgi:hypothetical protein
LDEVKSAASNMPELVALASDSKTIQRAQSNMGTREPSFPYQHFAPNASEADE